MSNIYEYLRNEFRRDLGYLRTVTMSNEGTIELQREVIVKDTQDLTKVLELFEQRDGCRCTFEFGSVTKFSASGLEEGRIPVHKIKCTFSRSALE